MPRAHLPKRKDSVTRMAWIVSIKGVLFDDQGRVLLGLNEHREWELIGGQLEPGEQPEQTLVREFQEEAGLDIQPGRLLGSYVFTPVAGGREVLIVAFECSAESVAVTPSDEHQVLEFHSLPLADTVKIPRGYAEMIRRAHEQRAH